MQLFSAEGFMPRSQCGPAWSPNLVALQQMSHTIIFLSYVFIAAALFFGLEVPRDKLGRALFGLFILSCAQTHLSNRLMFQWPAYRFDTAGLVVCAVMSAGCVVWLLLVKARNG